MSSELSNSTGSSNRRAVVLVIDGCGIGAAPDHDAYGDSSDCNTLANTARQVGGLSLPNMARLGLGNVSNIKGVSAVPNAQGYYGKLQEARPRQRYSDRTLGDDGHRQ